MNVNFTGNKPQKSNINIKTSDFDKAFNKEIKKLAYTFGLSDSDTVSFTTKTYTPNKHTFFIKVLDKANKVKGYCVQIFNNQNSKNSSCDFRYKLNTGHSHERLNVKGMANILNVQSVLENTIQRAIRIFK